MIIIMGNYYTPYSLRISEELKEKLKYIAKKNRRTLNTEITIACENYVEEFECQNGEIIIEEI